MKFERDLCHQLQLFLNAFDLRKDKRMYSFKSWQYTTLALPHLC